jgi:trimethylamine monooxygenase
MQDQWYTFTMFDAQAYWTRDVILGRIDVPDHNTMQADIDARIQAESELKNDCERIAFQGAYTNELVQESTDYPDFN